MSFLKSMQISASGLAAQRLRMNVLSSNLANAQTTSTAEGGPYKRKDVVFSAVPTGNRFEDFLGGTHNTQLQKVKVVNIHEDTADLEKFMILAIQMPMRAVMSPCRISKS